MKQEKGFSLIEVMIAMLLVGIIAIAFLGALATASKALIIADERATAESLARTQMEYVRNQDYDFDNNPPLYAQIPDEDIPDGYVIDVTAERLDPKGDGFDSDDGIQKIIVTVEHPELDEVIKLEGYRSLR